MGIENKGGWGSGAGKGPGGYAWQINLQEEEEESEGAVWVSSPSGSRCEGGRGLEHSVNELC
jgi:hypothetical protein